MIDTHAHLNFKAFKHDSAEVIRRSFAGGMKAIVIPGSNYSTSKRAVEIATNHNSCYAAVSLHPIHVTKEPFDKEKYRTLIKLNKETVKAIGETGIDLFHNPEDLALQKQVFIQHLELAKEYSLPVVLHCRGSKQDSKDGYKELLRIIFDNIALKPKGVMHCFQSDLDIAQQFLDLGFYLGFDGPITYKEASPDLLNAIKNISLGLMLLETDSPYLTPEPHRGERNEPLYVRFIAQKIAEIKNISFDDVIEATTKNAIQLFNIY